MKNLPYNQAGELLEVVIEGVDVTGRSFGQYQEKKVFCKGALPGERVVIKIAVHKKGYLIGDVVEVKVKSPYRVMPLEDHYLLCSPWQIMEYVYQCDLKKDFIQKSFNRALDSFVSSKEIVSYRTKMEFGFMEVNNELSFSVRGHNSKVPTDKCILATKAMNRVANEILRELRLKKVKANDLKSLVIRESKTTRELIVILYVKVKNDFGLKLSLFKGLKGLMVVFSDPERLISVATKVIYREGQTYLTERIGGIDISYPFNAFFQNNITLFKRTIENIREKVGPSKRAVEFYSGVGVIGLALHDVADELTSYEMVSSMVAAANINAENNGIRNYQSVCLDDKEIGADMLANKDLIILDPPRRGLDGKLVEDILKAKPRQIVYLSCNHVTQARDYNILKDQYKITGLFGYDYYPNTPHVESLLLLELK